MVTGAISFTNSTRTINMCVPSAVEVMTLDSFAHRTGNELDIRDGIPNSPYAIEPTSVSNGSPRQVKHFKDIGQFSLSRRHRCERRIDARARLARPHHFARQRRQGNHSPWRRPGMVQGGPPQRFPQEARSMEGGPIRTPSRRLF